MCFIILNALPKEKKIIEGTPNKLHLMSFKVL